VHVEPSTYVTRSRDHASERGDTDGADVVTAHAGALETKDGSPDEILPARHGVRSHHELTSCRKAVERPNLPRCE
jgi:hypothetical protein